MTKEANVGPPTPREASTTGSFGASKAIEEIEQRRAAEAIERGKSADAEKGEKEEEQSERDKEIDKLLPKEVTSALGDVPFDIFKEMYSGIWEQVESKEHLAKGFCTMRKEIATDLPVVFRTLKTNETHLVNQFAPEPGGEIRKYLDADSEYRKIQLAIGVMEFDGRESAPIETPTGSVEEWKDSQVVKERFDWIDGLPEEITALMSAVLTDVTIAYRLALRENLKNQLAPL
jgi:hypothetical protein